MEDELQQFLSWLSERYNLNDGEYTDEHGRTSAIHNIVWYYLETN